MRYSKGIVIGLTIGLLIVSLFLSMFSMVETKPVLAGDGNEKIIGEKRALPNGDETTYLGLDQNGKEIWQAVIGDPVYVKGTDIRYNCQWLSQGDHVYVSGANDFIATVDGRAVVVEYQGEESTWSPDISLDGVKPKESSNTPRLLAIDPINSNYIYNTLIWDYENGVKRYLRIIEGMLIEYYQIEYPLNKEFALESHLVDSAGFSWHRPVMAWDANGKPVEISDLGNHNYKFAKDGHLKTKTDDIITYPVTIDPDSTFYTSSSDGTWENYGDEATYAASWNEAHDAATSYSEASNSVILSTCYLYVRRNGLSPKIIDLTRAALYFGTSGLPDSANITAGTLSLYGAAAPDDDVGAWTLQVQSGMPTYPHDPLVDTDFNYTYYAGNGGQLTSVNMGTGYKDITLTADGLDWIDPTGDTKLVLRDATYDIADHTPPDAADTRTNNWNIYSYEQGAGYRPRLVVTYSVTTPEIDVESASSIAMTSARLNAFVVSDGGESCQVRWGYGTTNQTVGNFTAYDTVTSWTAATWTTGDHPYLDVTGLTGNTTYYYRAQIKNSSYNDTSDSSETFTTLYYVNAPTNFRAYPSNDSVDLAWIKGEGSSNTTIRYSLNSFPTDNASGTLLYSGVGQTTTHTGLSAGITYYYSAWARSTGNWSSTYATVAATTFILEPSTEDLDTPTAWPDWFQEPDYTNLSNLEPIYSIVNGVADSFGTPRNTVWIGLVLILIAIVSVLLMAKVGFEAGLIVSSLLLVAGVIIHILPAWFLMFTIIIGIFGWTMLRRGNA